MYQKRQQKVLNALKERGCDGLVLNAGPSLAYFSGLQFHLMERPVVFLLVAGEKPLIVVPALEEQKLDTVDFDLEAISYHDNPSRWQESFDSACRQIGLPGLKIGFEPRQLRMLEYGYLETASPSTTYANADEAISQCRALKDSAEASRMQKAVSIAQDSLLAILPRIGAGMSEHQVAAELVIELYRQGSEQPLPFSPIVAAGSNGANPHAKPSRRLLRQGDLLIIDWGARWQGYVSDLTRTFAIGQVDHEARRIHELVLRASAAGRTAARPEIPCSAVDNAARSVIEAGGYGTFFSHRTGHGIGMECHEEPYIHDGNESPLKPGMSFTIEPGIYLKGKYGVRIEDDVLITKDGNRSFSDLNRELLTI
ncbi:MAG: aminopeptidase P family protein [Desulfobulbaceae bacterium]|nr:MAG: aminopeptidase P family protein [Desulfobulbaceae bacterium]